MFNVLPSSAGGGKTHALVKHYLEHALADPRPDAYRQVLALTFTNKAAAEMRERVMEYLEQLAGGSANDARITDVRDFLVERTGATPEALAERATAVLEHMLQHWSEVAISTIDAFTRRVVKPFARDLRLDHELRMSTEEDHYLQRAVEDLLAEAGSDAVLTRTLIAACRQLLEEERGWNPAPILITLGKELRKEASIAPLEQLRGMRPEAFLEIARDLRSETEAFMQRVQAMGKKAMELLEGAGIDAAQLAHSSTGPFGYLRNLSMFKDQWKEPNKHVQKVLEKDVWHSGKADAHTRDVIASIADQLRQFILDAEVLREGSHPVHLLRLAILRELMPASVLHALDERQENAKRADGVTFFSDLTRRVAQIVAEEPVPFIHERLGERYRHFLIDEFQDTSLMQWQALLPLVENTLAGREGNGDTRGSVLLVGDAKQAIYRWRNGEVRQFIELPAIFGKDGSVAMADRENTLVRSYQPMQRLAGNHRSGKAIIAFNNDLFSALRELLDEDLRKVYDAHEQIAMRDAPGWVEVHQENGGAQAENEDTDELGEDTPAALAFTLDRIREAIGDGHVQGDIAVLVRTGAQVRSVAMHLQQAGLQVVSANGLTLAGDPRCELLIAVLQFIRTPTPDQAVRVSQYAALTGLASDQEQVDPFPEGSRPEVLAEALGARLKEHQADRIDSTLTALLERCAMAFGMSPSADQHLLALLDEAHAWSCEHGQDIPAFLEHWDRRGGQRAVEPTPGTDAVQVMTIHASKGLQFPVVIVPYTVKRSSNKQELLWVDTKDTVDGLSHALVRESAALREAGLPELLEEDRLRMLDAINLLYVAFTRAESRLCLLLPEKSNDVLITAIKNHLGPLENGPYLRGERTRSVARPATAPPQHMLGPDHGGGPRTPMIREQAPREWDPADPDPVRSLGNILHEVLAAVVLPSDLPAAVAQQVNAGKLTSTQGDDLNARLTLLLDRPDLLPWYGPGLRVRNEATLIDRDGHALRPDRVVMQDGHHRVLDLKTGTPHEHHHDQVRRYMTILGEITGGTVEGALLYLGTEELIPVTS